MIRKTIKARKTVQTSVQATIIWRKQPNGIKATFSTDVVFCSHATRVTNLMFRNFGWMNHDGKVKTVSRKLWKMRLASGVNILCVLLCILCLCVKFFWSLVLLIWSLRGTVLSSCVFWTWILSLCSSFLSVFWLWLIYSCVGENMLLMCLRASSPTLKQKNKKTNNYSGNKNSYLKNSKLIIWLVLF